MVVAMVKPPSQPHPQGPDDLGCLLLMPQRRGIFPHAEVVQGAGSAPLQVRVRCGLQVRHQRLDRGDLADGRHLKPEEFRQFRCRKINEKS